MKRKPCSYRHLAAGFVLFVAGALFILTESFAGQISPFQSKQTPRGNQVPHQAQVSAAIDPALLGDRGPSGIRARLQGGGPDEVVPVIIQMAGDPLGRVSVEHGWSRGGLLLDALMSTRSLQLRPPLPMLSTAREAQ